MFFKKSKAPVVADAASEVDDQPPVVAGKRSKEEQHFIWRLDCFLMSFACLSQIIKVRLARRLVLFAREARALTLFRPSRAQYLDQARRSFARFRDLLLAADHPAAFAPSLSPPTD